MKKQYQMQYSHKSTLYYEIKTNSYEKQYQMKISNDIPGQISQFKTKGKWHHRCKQTRSSLSIHVQSSLWPSMENSANHVYHSLFRMGAFFWCCQYCHHTDLYLWLTYTVLYVAHVGACVKQWIWMVLSRQVTDPLTAIIGITLDRRAQQGLT